MVMPFSYVDESEAGNGWVFDLVLNIMCIWPDKPLKLKLGLFTFFPCLDNWQPFLCHNPCKWSNLTK